MSSTAVAGSSDVTSHHCEGEHSHHNMHHGSRGMSSSGTSNTLGTSSSSGGGMHVQHDFNAKGIAERQAQQESMVYSTAPALASGAVLAVMFNPLDRALYLRVHHRRPFFDMNNWRSPFQGFGNAAVYRTVCSASYLMWQDTGTKGIAVYAPSIATEAPFLAQLLVGLFAGAANGLLLNQLQIIKYRMWSDGSGTFWSVSRNMLREAGPAIFARGVGVSVGRDVMFGSVYEVLRAPHLAKQRGDWIQFMMNVLAACVASCFSSPLNYCRNVIYGAPPSGCPLRLRSLVVHLVHECRRESTLLGKWKHLNSRLNIGWGSFRVGLGMGVGQGIFKFCKELLHSRTDHKQVSSVGRRM